MPQTVEIPDHGIAEFPDDMTPDQIKGVIQSKFYASPTPQPTATPQAGEVAAPIIQSATDYGQQQGAPSVEEQRKMYESLPESVRKPLDAAAETVAGFVPKSATEIAGFATPVVGAVEDISKAAHSLSDVVFGGKGIDESVSTNYPESQVLAEADKTPPFSKERYRAGFGTLAQIGMGAALGRGLIPKSPVATTAQPLTETIFGKEPDPLTAAVNEGLTEAEKYGTQPETPNAIEPSNAQVETGTTAQRVQAGSEGAVTGTGSSDNALGEAQGAAEPGQIPARKGTEAQPQAVAPQEQVAPEHPELERLRGEYQDARDSGNTPGMQRVQYEAADKGIPVEQLQQPAPVTSAEAATTAAPQSKFIDQARTEYPTKPEGWSQERYDTFLKQRAGAIEDASNRESKFQEVFGKQVPVSATGAEGAGEALPAQGAGAASREEFMHRYQLIGASKVLEGHTELGKFSQEMMKEEPSIPKDDLNEIFNRSKQVVNDLQTAGQSKSQISDYITKELSKPKPAPFENIRVRPISALKDQYKAAEKAGSAGYKRGLKEARDEGKAAAAQIRQELAMSDKWMAGDQEQVRQNMVDYVNSALPPAERGRFIGAITRALRRPALRSGIAQSGPDVMYRHAFNVMKAIENRAGEVYKSNIIQDIRDTLSKSLEAPGIDVAYRRKLKAVADTISGTKPTTATLARLQGLQDFVNRERAAGREPNIPQEHLDELKNLTRLPLKKMPINALEKLQEQVNSLVSLGRLKAKLMERQWENAKANSVAALSKEPSNPIELRPLYKPQPTEKLTVGQKFVNAVRKTMNFGQTGEKSIAPMDEIYDHLDGARGTYDGFASQNFKGNLDLAFNEREAELQPIKAKSNEIIKKYGLNKADMETIQTKAIMNMVGRERLEAMGVRPDILDKIEKTPLTEGQKAYTDFIRQQYDSVGKRVSDIAHKLYQIDMKPVDDYVPLMRDWAEHGEREAPTPLADPISGEVPFNETATMNQIRRDMNPNIVSRTEQGFLKERIEGAKTAVKLNAEEVFNRHIADALHFIHGQPVLKMLGEIARSPEFAAKYGKEGQKIVLDHLDSVSNNGFVGHLNRIRVLDWIRNSTSKGAVGFRVASNFVHTSQLPLAAYHAGGPQWWSKGLNLSLTEKGQQFLRRNAAETYVRGGGEPAQAEVEALTGKFGRAGFFVARNIDKLNAQATFMGRYAKEMTERGVPIDQVLDAPVNPEVQSLALRRMHRAVASPQAKDIPQMTSRGKMFGGNVSVARAVNQFRNIFLDNWSNIRHDILRTGRKDAEAVIDHLRKGEIAAGAKTVGDAVSHRAAVAAAILSGIAMETGIKLYTKKVISAGMSAITGVEPPKVKGQEEKTYLSELQHHMLNRIPFVGQVASAIMYGQTGIPTIDAIVSPLKEIGIASKAHKPETQAKHYVRTAGQVSTLLGIPGSSQAIEAFEPTLSKKLGEHLPDKSVKKKATTKPRHARAGIGAAIP